MKHFLKRIAAGIFASTILLSYSQITSFALSKETDLKTIAIQDQNEQVILERTDELLDTYGITVKSDEKRLPNEEKDLFSAVFEAADGSRSEYIFDEEIKYVDDNGAIADKSNTLMPIESVDSAYSDYRYSNKYNNINTLFPDNLQNDKGIILKSEMISLEMYPFESNTSEVKIVNNKQAVYKNAFESSVDLQYEATYSGFKENIVLYDDTKSEFDFIVETERSELVQKNGIIYFVDPATGDTIANFSPILVYDSAFGKKQDEINHFTYDNKFDFTKISEGQYKLHISVDKDFISSDNTVYPVYVDPSVTVTATTTGTKTILDTPIYNGAGAAGNSAGANSLSVLGYVGSSYGSGRLMMKFPGVYNKPFMSTNYTIDSAKLYFKEQSGLTGNTALLVYMYTGSGSWDETSVYSSALWNNVGGVYGSASFSGSDVIFDITSPVRSWQTSVSSRSKGIQLRNNWSETNINYRRVVNTSENTIKPYVVVTYFYNGCRDYIPLEYYSTKNCLLFAFDRPGVTSDYDRQHVLPGVENYSFMNPSVTVSNVLNTISGLLASWLNNTFPNKWRGVSSYNSYLYPDEYLVCLRVGKNSDRWDYHFWFRASNGKWYDKHGWNSYEECLGSIINPGNVSSTCPGWALTYNYTTHYNFYTSNILYYAVKI